ncbi:uncharacterized protein LOC106157753 [Lingula anatina]|uniref:Uncharacterized protein LOC106157753 n=1 Tax=Lingula anatina TaxID=7574 RepID=A0A1S3HTS9_LINAN|nr:uncharacterized protein LOC106157753 [Lingula anatina]|eukprot:XP_013388951.1 uncharacterized protein LOC106157753 [Lingula anatina]
MKTLIIFFAVLAVALGADTIRDCKTKADCNDDECCVPEMNFLLLSKRGLADLPFRPTREGRCVAYIQKNASCHNLGFATCGCAPGLQCNYYPDGKTKRRIPWKPGSSFCEDDTQ